MKIEKNVLSIMREMLADPEKDWSNHLPLMKLTEEDFVKGAKLIKKHIKNADRREEVMEGLDRFINRYESGNFYRQQTLKDFVRFLEWEIGKNKRWSTKVEIEKEIKEVLETEKFYALEPIFTTYEEMFTHLNNMKIFQGHFQETHKELLENFNFKDASALLKEHF